MKIYEIYNSLFEVKHSLDSISDLILLTPSTNNNDGGLFLFYHPKTKKPIGYISFGYLNSLDVYSVGGIYANNGYGPLLYEIGMTYVYPKGLTLSQDSGTSFEAEDVWDKFYLRNDVKKEKIIKISKSDKEIDLIDGCDGDEDCLDSIKKIIYLHNTKFIYSFGKSNLLSLIKNGKNYTKLNNISDEDIEHMSWDLE